MENYRLAAYFVAVALNGGAVVYFSLVRDRLAYSLAFAMFTLCAVAFSLALLLSQALGSGQENLELRNALMTLLATFLVIAPAWTLYEFHRKRSNNNA